MASDYPSGVTSVLIVEDNAEIRELYVHYLGYVGMSPHAATDGIEAVTKARELRPDVIVMDLHIPRQDGLQAMRALKADARTKSIPVLPLTGDYELESRARDAYCAAFLKKPCLPEQLAAEIRRGLGARKRKPSKPPVRTASR